MPQIKINLDASFAAQTFAVENWPGQVYSMMVRSLAAEPSNVLVTVSTSFGVEYVIADETGALAYGPTAAATHRAWRDQAGNGVAGFRPAPVKA